MKGARIGWRDHLVGLALCASYVALLLGTAADIGMSRDEGFYVEAAERYAAWIDLLLDDPAHAVRHEVVSSPAHWAYNNEHPPLVKTLFALGHLAQREWEPFEQPSNAYRLPGMLMSGLLLWLVYVFGARAYGRHVGAFAALALALMPRVFYHAHLNAFDVPITLMMTWVTYCYWRSLTDRRWAIGVGIAYGLALATKHNAWTLPLILLVHWWLVVLTELRARRTPRAWLALALVLPIVVVPIVEAIAWRRRTPRGLRLTPWWLLAMAVLGPPIFVGLWPWLWFDTIARFGAYAGFHLNHAYYNMAYFGVNYFQPPFPVGYPFVMALFTLPLVTVALALAGLGTRARALLPPVLMERIWPRGSAPDAARTDVLAFGSMLAPLVVIAMPWTPIFGGTKHWFSAYPFLAMFAGIAAVRVAGAAQRTLGERVPRAHTLARVGTAAVLLAPAAVETVHSHPFGLSHYTFAAGGVPGAADHGMNRQFWGFTTRSLVGWLEERMPAGGTVWICDTTWTAWRMLQRDGHLDERIRATGDLVAADYAIVHHEHHFVEVDYQIWAAWRSVRPAHVLTYDGVPIVSVYENPARAARRQGPLRMGPVR